MNLSLLPVTFSNFSVLVAWKWGSLPWLLLFGFYYGVFYSPVDPDSLLKGQCVNALVIPFTGGE